ncbi:MAG: EamA family transporter [Armatimonadetes bacterium]|nr:EamA family transporter [Armatimonadota bacterium]
MPEVTRWQQFWADFALLAVTFIWGVTFVVVKDALGAIGPYYFLAIRFFLAALFLKAAALRNIRKCSENLVFPGIVWYNMLQAIPNS